MHRSTAVKGNGVGSRPPSLHSLESPSSSIAFQPNDTIYAPGQIRRALYRVDHGVVRIYRLLASGRRHICSFEFSGDVFGFEPDDNHLFFAEAVSQTSLRALSLLEDAIPDAGPVLQNMERIQRNLLVLGHRDPIERVAAFMCDLEFRQGGTGVIELSMSRADIADHLCVSIETISRVFTCLRLKGIIKLRAPRIVEIVRPRALKFLTE